MCLADYEIETYYPLQSSSKQRTCLDKNLQAKYLINKNQML